MVQSIKDMDELKTFLKAAGCKLVVVEFSAKWCGPCQRIYPLVHELAQIYHVKAVPTFQMFKQTQKVTLFSRLKRAICCYGSGFVGEPIFEFCGADAQKLEAKIQELM
ncbi:thioredoxin domain-containing protein 8 isoform X2 [Canis lupus baileyi]|uniref:thioredoxin domain-containing protein 8 isoform X2 n=1 Tax=Canis lupus dingo TaxID=286419 RepID=UPI000DC699C3|nr:thioredoxin domain-containing protein 8 isoform X2 [Canis lupus dingo]XP_038409010.1 thioredoxin domain-containing protein 8 isoform X2 [Canis lupus familiaris]XP_038523148.1 thioredoxin domain-containing protein 8 isoform X2 [Canis lupus familiaris]XP_038538346.1 thioredoxin domain-containing protein 8 isoform X2 [Canis lupus familiaris]